MLCACRTIARHSGTLHGNRLEEKTIRDKDTTLATIWGRRGLLAAFVLSFLSVLMSAPAPLSAEGVHASSYMLDVRCRPDEAFLQGSAVVALREAGQPASSLHFWLHGELHVTSITSGGQELDCTQEPQYYRRDYSLIGNQVEVPLAMGQVPDTIRVEWEGYFHPSAARSPSDYMRIDSSGVFLRALGYSPWFPIFLGVNEDEYNVAFPEVGISVPNGLTAVFTGDLVSRENDHKEAHSTWRAESVSLYSPQLAARQFRVSSEEGVYVYSLDDKGSLEAGKAIAGLAASLLEYYRTHYRGDAISGQLHIVEMPAYGDISSGNVIGIQESAWRGFSESVGSKYAVAHELVHPFVQPSISRSDPLYALMIEGFPSYFHYPALAALGVIDYDDVMARVRDDYLEKRKTGEDWRGRPLPEEKPISAIGPDEIGIYKDRFVLADRALLLLDTLREKMGQARFEEFVRRLFSENHMDDGKFRALVIEYLPDFKEQLGVWLDSTELPAGLK
jgi:hypothetical protein